MINKITPAALLLSIALSSSLQAQPRTQTRAASPTEVKASPQEESAFKTLDAIFDLVLNEGFKELKQRKEELQKEDPSVWNRILKEHSFEALDTHGDVGFLLVLLLDSLDKEGNDKAIQSLHSSYSRLDNYADTLSPKAQDQLFIKWRRSRSVSNSAMLKMKQLGSNKRK